MTLLRKIPGPAVAVALSAVCVVAGVWVCLGRDAAEKIATSLVMPTGIVWLMLLTVTIRFWPLRHRSEERPKSVLVLFTLLVYTAAGNGHVSSWLATTLEVPWQQLQPLAGPVPDIVVVLGGGAAQGGNGRVQGNSSGDRLILAAQIAHQWPTTKFICTGRRIESMNASGVDPATASRDVLVKLGVAADAIELLGGRNTSEEMKTLAERFRDREEPIGLVTSAWHMSRATQLATANGLHVVPLPADFRTASPTPLTAGQIIAACIPDANAFAANWWFLREHLGMLLGR